MRPLLTSILLVIPALAALAGSPQEDYVQQYAPLAVSEMRRSGVPASITLAQGILESGSGLSKLAAEGNNHFGIKCHRDWKGKTMNLDDDLPGECFRVYDSPEESYRDHSDFLRYRDRYKFLFDLEPTDYDSWAYGLKEAGYATDPQYPQKLIQYIEKYDLSRFDKLSATDIRAELPPPPHQLEIPVAAEEFSFRLSRTLYSMNGVPLVYAAPGETYASIARAHDLFTGEIRRFNDAPLGSEPLPGEVVYLAAKKARAQEGLEKYIVEQNGESLRAICQRFAVRERAIRRLNGFGLTGPVDLNEGDVIKLR